MLIPAVILYHQGGSPAGLLYPPRRIENDPIDFTSPWLRNFKHPFFPPRRRPPSPRIPGYPTPTTRPLRAARRQRQSSPYPPKGRDTLLWLVHPGGGGPLLE